VLAEIGHSQKQNRPLFDGCPTPGKRKEVKNEAAF
jgi:hypothetical protein